MSYINTTTNITACPAPWKATSNGAWSGDDPTHFALPLLILQLALILGVSRVLHFLLKPLHQPRVIAEIAGGIVLGASALGYIPNYTLTIFPPASLTVLTTFANFGLILFLFLVGLELDLRALKKTGKVALYAAAAGISLPFVLGVGVSFVIRSSLGITSKFGPFLVFMGVAMSITAFPVLARILAERKLLTTDIGQIAMSAAAVNDVIAWILLALAVALSASSSPSVVAWILLSGVAFVVFMLVVVRPLFALVGKRVVDNEAIPEWIVAVTLVGVFASAFMTDLIGIHVIFGAFVFGFVMPKDGPFAAIMIEKLEDLTNILLLPLYFASSGLSVNLESIHTTTGAGMVFLVIATACVGKIGGTVAAALCCKIPMRKSLVLGFLMNTKGLVELIVLNIGLQKKVINQEVYTIMVIMALFTTFLTTPVVMFLYEPARERVPYIRRKLEDEGGVGAGAGKAGKEELRLTVCIHGMKTIPGMLNLTELMRGTRKRAVMAVVLHLVEFSERSSAIAMVTRVRRNGRPFTSTEAQGEGQDQITLAFTSFAKLSKVKVEAMTAISAFGNMHDDVCGTAAEKRTNLLVLPYHKYLAFDGQLETGNPGFQSVNASVLQSAPCSVAILVDRGLGGLAQVNPGQVSDQIAVLFFGGPDDREALAVAMRMGEHPGTQVRIFHFTPTDPLIPDDTSVDTGGELSLLQNAAPEALSLSADKLESELDTRALEHAKSEADVKQKDASESGEVLFEHRHVSEAAEAAMVVAREGYNLLIIGRGRKPCPLIGAIPNQSGGRYLGRGREEAQGLGSLGDILVGQFNELNSSLLVVQQFDASLVKATPKSASLRIGPLFDTAAVEAGEEGEVLEHAE